MEPNPEWSRMMLPKFQNEPLTDFTNPATVDEFEDALEKVRAEFGRKYPLVIDGEEIFTDRTFNTTNPANPGEVLAVFSKADQDHAARAVLAAHEAYKEWQHYPAEERARYLLKAAAEMRRRKHEFSATMVLEVGKNWIEADADTAEAIDFMEYYARQMMKLDRAAVQLYPYPPEEVDLRYIALGAGIVIPPWNFPCAIATGMTAASIVTGNGTVLKPATNAPMIAYKMCELFWEQGIPAGVLNFTPGSGSEIGDLLVDHPKTRFIAFTGSKEVGLRIFQRAAEIQPGQIWLKRTILEMGGKDAVVVAEDADLDLAAAGIVTGAFGYQGQKCSAGSRAIIVEEVYDQVVAKVLANVDRISIGPPEDNENWLGPVIDQYAHQNILNYIEIGKKEAKLLAGGDSVEVPEGGYFIAPTIFGDVPEDARIAQEEIFGPVLAIIKAKDYDDALRIANGTEYGLTGAVYSKSRAKLECARREFHVGNLYFNRKCTGALVGVHPFGGFNMSGTDSKAGGPDYLLLFTQAKSIGDRLTP
jgi:1-pyrroline-5-carboxylate dehydrogenase